MKGYQYFFHQRYIHANHSDRTRVCQWVGGYHFLQTVPISTQFYEGTVVSLSAQFGGIHGSQYAEIISINFLPVCWIIHSSLPMVQVPIIFCVEPQINMCWHTYSFSMYSTYSIWSIIYPAQIYTERYTNWCCPFSPCTI